MMSLLWAEIYKLFRQGKTYYALGALFMIEAVVMVSAYFEGNNIIEILLDNLRKSFYFEATGMSVRMFNDAVAYVLGNRSSDDSEKFLNKTGKKEGIPVPKKLKSYLTDSNSEHVVKCLKDYFTFKVEWSPHERDLRNINMIY
jgi:hypothetical protein